MRAQVRVWKDAPSTRFLWRCEWPGCPERMTWISRGHLIYNQHEALNEALDHAATHHHYAPEGSPE